MADACKTCRIGQGGPCLSEDACYSCKDDCNFVPNLDGCTNPNCDKSAVILIGDNTLECRHCGELYTINVDNN